MLLRTVLNVTPSDVFVNDETGQVVAIGDKRYLILARDPWTIQVCRYYWFDTVIGAAYYLYRRWRKKPDEATHGTQQP